MLQYLVILLDDTSVSFCHYENRMSIPRLIPIDVLREGIMFGMKNNLRINFVYPEFDLPDEYKDCINSIDHTDIVSCYSGRVDADVVIYNDVKAVACGNEACPASIVLRISKEQLFEQAPAIESLFGKVSRLNIVFSDVESFSEKDFEMYREVLSNWSKALSGLYIKGRRPQINLITDRMMLESMNNCGAGDNCVTLAPDGCFYVCPGFYHVDDKEEYGLGKSRFNVGSLKDGLNIKNPQLYKLDYAPICCECDAFHCKRCVWLNRMLTYEVNTPGRQQCILSHIERSASKELLEEMRGKVELFDSIVIKDIDYVDPFDKMIKDRY